MVEQSRSRGLADRVTFRGRVAQTDLPWYFSAADILVLPSSFESFGMVILEALACGTPVAATRVGATEDLLGDVLNGRLSKNLLPASLADAIEDLLKSRMASPFRTESIRRSVARYDWSHITVEVSNIYQAVLAAATNTTANESSGGRGLEEHKAACCDCGLLAYT